MTAPPPVTTPRWAARLLDLALPAGEHGQTIRGDLLEELRARAATRSPRAARAWYRRQALSLALRYLLGAPRATTLASIGQDLRFAFRTLRSSRRFTAAAVATLAIGIGASTAIFSIVNAMLLRPLPYPDSRKLMWLGETTGTGRVFTVSWPNYVDWRDRAASFTDLAASRAMTMTVTAIGKAQRVEGRQVTWNFFPVLGISPAIGRGFVAADDAPSPVHPILLSDAFWTSAFGRDPAILGRRVMINGDPHEVVGVLPAGARYVRDYAIFEPLGTSQSQASFLNRGNHQGTVVLGRLKPGVTEAAARSEMDAIAAALAREYPDTNSGQGAHLETLSHRIVGNLRPALIAVIAAVGFLLLIACLNVANLLIAHGAARRHELAVRSALGCGRLRLIRQLLLESLVLSGGGGLLGLAAGYGFVKLLIAVAPADLPRLDEVRLDSTVLLFAFAATAVAGLVFGVIPAIHASATRGQQLVVRASRGGAVSSHRLRRALLVIEVAMALVLLAGAGLMVRTMRHLTAFDPGFSPDRLLTLRYSLEGPEWSDERVRAFHADALARVRALAGVERAALTYSLPIEGSQWGSVFIVGDQPVPPRAELPSAAFTPVSDGYFETLGLRLRAGRVLRADDGVGAPSVAVVNERFAKRFWPDGQAIGHRLKQGWPESKAAWLEIVGVVNDIKLDGIESDTPLQVYMPLAQSTDGSMAVIARWAPGTANPSREVAAAIGQLNPNLPVYGVKTMDDLMRASIARQRLSMTLFGAFAGMALLLASVGLYGVVSHGVAERTREVGVRLALGASRRQVLGLFLRQGLTMTVAGAVMGLTGALLLSRFLEDLLFEVAPTDFVTLAGVALLLFVVALTACYLPARRATRVSPTVALRD